MLLEEKPTDLWFEEIHVVLVIRLNCGYIPPVSIQSIPEYLAHAYISDQNILYKVMTVLSCTALENLNKMSSTDDVNTDGNIIGGYTPLHWDTHSGWKKDNDTFVFNISTNLICTKIHNYTNIK